MREKILEKPLNMPIDAARKKLSERMARLAAQWKEQNGVSAVYSWKKDNRMVVEAGRFGVKCEIILSETKIKVYAEMPFYVALFMGSARDTLISGLEDEVNAALSVDGDGTQTKPAFESSELPNQSLRATGHWPKKE